jgi:GNAT superfamily N-acetyltransferase
VTRFGAVERLRRDHDVGAFDCGKEALNRYLKRHAWANQQAEAARTYVVAVGLGIVGYHSLAAGSFNHDEAPPRVSKGLARHQVPVVLLARLAVDLAYQGQGLGPALLKDALQRAAVASESIGARALLVHAKDDEARAFYEHFGFDSSPTDAMHLFLVMKDLKLMIRS